MADMGEVLKEFAVKFSLQFDEKKWKKAKEAVDGFGEDLKHMSLHIAEASAAIFEMGNITGEHARALEESSQQLGINSERLQELQYAAKVAANVSETELVSALDSVNKKLFEARMGGTQAAEAFTRLQLPVSFLTDKTKRADEVLLAVADRLSGVQDPVEKAYLASQIFGDSLGSKLIPLLNKTGPGIAKLGLEARNMGTILSEKAIKQGAEFDRTLSRLWIVMKNITYTVGTLVIKNLMPLVQQFQKFVVVNKQFIAQGIGTIFKALGLYLMIALKFVSFFLDKIKLLVTALGGMEKVLAVVAALFGTWEIGKVAVGFYKAYQAIKPFIGLMVAANAQFVLIGAGILLAILAIQDFYTYLKGGDSYFGDFINWLKDIGKSMISFFDPALQLIDKLIAGFSQVMDFVGGFPTGVGDAIAKLIPGAGAFGKVLDFLPGAKATAEGFGAFKSAAAPGSTTAAGGGESNQENNFAITQTIQVPPGTNAQQAASIVQSGTSDAMDSMWRRVRNQAVGGEAY